MGGGGGVGGVSVWCVYVWDQDQLGAFFCAAAS